ncbi:HAD family hydrolase [Streptomyces sp. NBC_00715]|uniref:HAD family hydrolase n=1 Tax=Streptomyces sp. NBC_00715 TaxID=2975811 RepID=UPI00386F423F
MKLMDAVGRPAVAALFDCDGLLADTEPLWGAAMERVLHDRDCLPDGMAQLTLELTGASIDCTVQRLTDLMGLPAPSSSLVEDALLTAYAEIAAERGVCAMPGAASLVRTVAGELPVAVVSNSPQRVVLATLDALRLTNLMSVVVGAHGTCQPKPSPEPYLLACQLLGVPATRCAAFEDSVPGARAAAAAGIGVTVVPPPEAITASYPAVCRIVSSLNDVVAHLSSTAPSSGHASESPV